ncbi:MAG: non-ribosomal peptide synthetase [bacterium]|nr:non-ribosomal peptide synthetase [bacterium]
MIEYLNNRHDYWKTRKNYAIYSTNCSIKQIGDYGHLEGAGYHYYGGATSWEKRLGHITLDNLREDLTCSASKQSYDNFVDRVGGLPKELQTDEKYLVAYIVSNKDDLDAAGLRKFLEDKIPSYMIPSYFQQIDEIPLSSNGKLDRKRLPAPEKTQASDAEYIQPETVTEEKLAQVWHEVLALPMEKIGIDDSFFALGGDSIKAIQISARLQAHNLKMDLSQLFANPTIRELAPTIQATDRDIPQGPVEGDVPLTPIQAWFFEKKLSDSHHFNQSVMMYAEKGFVENAVNEALGGIMAHHDALRMSFTPLDVSEGEAESADGEGIPRINRELGIRQQNGGLLSGPIAVEVFDFREQPDCAELIVRECDRIQASMRLDGGAMSGGAGMLRAGLFKTPEGDHILLAVHHLVIDGVSWRIIFEDFAAAYTQCLEGKEITLPPKSDSFQYWAVQLEQYAQEEQFLKELDFWKEMESKEIEPLPRPGGASAPEVRKSKDSVSVAMTLDKELTAQLLTEVNTAFNTEINDLLLTALGMAFSRWSKANGGSGGSVLINLEGHGREDILENINISRTVGWFTSMYPVLLEIETTADLADLIKGTKESLRRIPNKGIGYGVLKYLTPGDKTQEIQFKLKPEIVFNYLGQFDGGEGNGDSSYGMSFMGRGAEVGPESEGSDVFSINGMVSGGQLQMVFGYNRFEYEEEMVSQLSGFYKEALEGIVNFCMGKEDTEYTVSDFDADLDDDDMGDIYDELDIE